jgi:hypothetical protein
MFSFKGSARARSQFKATFGSRLAVELCLRLR